MKRKAKMIHCECEKCGAKWSYNPDYYPNGTNCILCEQNKPEPARLVLFSENDPFDMSEEALNWERIALAQQLGQPFKTDDSGKLIINDRYLGR